MKKSSIRIEFEKIMEDDYNRSLFESSLLIAAQINPNKDTNPCQSLEEFYEFLDWAETCLPWNVLNKANYSSLYKRVDQSVDYLWFLFDIKLDELIGKGYYNNSLQYHEPFSSWIKYYSKRWGSFLSSKESWKEEYYLLHKKEDAFGLNKGWYADTNIWHSFNDFFTRHLINKDVRPIGEMNVVSPADSVPQGIWDIEESGYIEDGVLIKSRDFDEVDDLLGVDSKYRGRFNGGTLTHMFLDVNDYHRYHFPVDGKIVEMRKIDGVNAAGGRVVFDSKSNSYILVCKDTSWQMIETRDCIILETKYGLVAILPIGMSQVCSCNFEDDLYVGKEVKKGDPLGYFLFGGSDIVVLFEKGIKFNMVAKKGEHILMGENYGEIKRN